MVDVQILSRDGAEPCERSLAIDHDQMAKAKQDLEDELRFSEGALIETMKGFLLGKSIDKHGIKDAKSVAKITDA